MRSMWRDIYSTLNKESLLEAIFASIVSCIPDSDDKNSFPGVSSVWKTKHNLEKAHMVLKLSVRSCTCTVPKIYIIELNYLDIVRKSVSFTKFKIANNPK